MKRFLTSICLIVMLVAFLVCGYFVSPIFVDMLVLLFMGGATYEMFVCLKRAGYKMFVAPPVLVLLTAYPAFYLMQYYVGEGSMRASAGLQGLMIVLLAGFMLVLSMFTFSRAHNKNKSTEKVETEKDSEAHVEASSCAESAAEASQSVGTAGLNDLFANIFVLVYPMFFLTAAWVISYKYSAIFAILFAIAVPVIGSDLFAYFVGSLIKGKKLCPSISPKKTISGAVGGVIGGMVVAILLWVVFEYVGYLFPSFAEQCGYMHFFSTQDGGWMWKSALVYLAIGLLMGAISELGDLAASRIKRAIGIKDYGKIFPGHGGFLDRIDSIMYCLVVLLVALAAVYGY